MKGALKRTKANKACSPQELEGSYIQVGSTTVRAVLQDGKFRWGSNDVHLKGTYAATKLNEYAYSIAFKGKFCSFRRRLIRRDKNYFFQYLPGGEDGDKYRREDGAVFLEDSLPLLRHKTLTGQSFPAAAGRHQARKLIEDSNAAVSFYLTGESVVRAAMISESPSSKTPATVRVTHSNSLGRVDSDVFVRIGDPKAPLEWDDFDTVSDWQQASLVEDLLDDGEGGWVSRGKAKGDGVYWSGTYETEIQFSKGHHLIEIKIISRVPEVCSIVLSNWKFYVR